jgi:hypothetical protein
MKFKPLRILYFFPVFAAIFFSGQSWAQCPTDPVSITTQQDIDNFPAGCTVLDGSIYLTGPQITNLSNLSSVITITGDVNIDNTGLTSFQGFDNLETIGGNLRLSDYNSSSPLTSLTHLEKLNSTRSIYLYISVLEDISAISNIENVRSITIENSKLTTLDTFHEVLAVNETKMAILNNPLLTSVNVLSKIEKTETFTISNNPLLTSISGSDKLQIITAPDDPFRVEPIGLTISENATLAQVTAFNNLITAKNVILTDNPLLTGINFLDNLETVELGFSIRKLNTLTEIPSFPKLTSTGGFSVSDNSSLVHLVGPANLTKGHLLINLNGALKTVSGFQKLGSGNINILVNNELETISGMGSLAEESSMQITLNNKLTSISGFSNITKLRYLSISENAALTTLEGLNNLESVTEYVTVESNAALLNLDALSNIKSLTDLQIRDHAALTSLGNFSKLTSVYNLIIASNSELTSLSGLSALTNSTGGIAISSNPKLTSLTGLDKVESSPGIMVTSNNALTSLQGLGGMKSMESVRIDYNSALTSLSGLNQDLLISGYLEISNNSQLGQCAIAPICAFLASGSSIQLANNTGNCNNQNDILALCETVPPLELTSFTVIPNSPSPDQPSVKLQWTTAKEIKSDRFEIYWDRGWTLEKIGEIAGAGASTSPINYEFTHAGTQLGKSIYYLLMYNKDGRYTKSEPRTIEMTRPYDPVVISGCEKISGTYNVENLDAGRYSYQAAHPCLIGSDITCDPQSIRYQNGKWRLFIEVGMHQEEMAHSDDQSMPGAPAAGWVATDILNFCNRETFAVTRPGTKTASCSGCNWSDPNIWTPSGVPAFENVVIQGNVILDIHGTTTDLTIPAGKSVTSPAGRTLTIHGKLDNKGLLQTGRLESNGFYVSQEIDGSKLTTTSFSFPNLGSVKLTGPLSVLNPANPGVSNVTISGKVDIGDYDLECEGITFPPGIAGGGALNEVFVLTSGNGSLKYNIPAGDHSDKTFVIGMLTKGEYKYTPARLMRENPDGPAVTLSARVSPDFSNPLPEGANFVPAQWTLSASEIPEGDSYRVGLEFASIGYSGPFDATNVYVKRWAAGNWHNMSGAQNLGSSSTAWAYGVTEFSPWGIFDSEKALPVRLISFTVSKAEQNTAKLMWATSTETNSSHFEIEHSIDAKKWSRLAEIQSNGESNAVKNYGYLHLSPSGGLNYYRLKSVDFDQTYSYSQIRSFELKNAGAAWVLFPNPVSETLNIKPVIGKNVIRLEIFNLLGQKIMSVSQPAEGVDVSRLSAGFYTARIYHGDNSCEVHNLVIKR